MPYIGTMPLASLTSARLTALYRELEESGHRNHKGERTGKPLSARTVRGVATMLGAALDDEVPLLTRNPAVKAKPPTAKEANAKAPEMHPWTAEQLRRFLGWARENSRVYAAWYLPAYTGMRRGELLALRWRDIDLDAATISIRRSVGIARVLLVPVVPFVSTTRISSLAWLAWGAAARVSGVADTISPASGFRHAAFSMASSVSAAVPAAFSVLAGLLFGE